MLPYYGGKNARGTGAGRWVARQLPAKVGVYVEPFAGMLGVLRQRLPAPREVASDLSVNLVRFWLGVRDDPTGLRWRHWWLSNSRTVLMDCRCRLSDGEGDALDAAASALLSADLSVMTVGGRKEEAKWSARKGAKFAARRDWLGVSRRIARLDVRHADALDTVSEFAGDPDALLYLDPPYTGVSDTQAYGSAGEDFDPRPLLPALADARARVAVSGYAPYAWDELGWRTEALKVPVTVGGHGEGLGNRKRTEVLWMNW